MRTFSRAIPFVLATGLLVTAPACAAPYRYTPYPYGDHDRDRGWQARAYQNGVEEGREEGRNDARHGQRFDYDRHREFRDADQGYSRRDGPREEYREAFRRGFVAGYNDGYRVNWRGRDSDDEYGRWRR